MIVIILWYVAFTSRVTDFENNTQITLEEWNGHDNQCWEFEHVNLTMRLRVIQMLTAISCQVLLEVQISL